MVDVKPNGTLILEATEDIKTDEEEQKLTLIGTCRVEDITADNTILSNQLFNLHLEQTAQGCGEGHAHQRGMLHSIIGLDQSILTMVMARTCYTTRQSSISIVLLARSP